MHIEKLSSGSYRITQTINKVRHRITVDHKPTKAEALKLISEKINDDGHISSDMPFKRACECYIESKSNVLSPSSIRGYKSVTRQISDTLMNVPINIITKPMVQTEINKYSSDHSPKSTANLSGFIASVLKFYGNDVGKVTLPQKEKKTPYIPTEEEVHAIFKAVKGTKYEVPILLSAMGLRRSEIAALEVTDLSDNNVLTINKAKVQDENYKWVIKQTKTTDSTRTIVLPDYLADLIRTQGYVYNGHPELIYRKLTELQSQLGIKHFSLHKMRHFFASYLHQLGYTDKQIQSAGGWKTDNIMKTVYQHAMDMENAKTGMANSIGKLM